MNKVHRSHGNGDDNTNGHIIIFPFMAKGHTIPLIHLATHLTSTSRLRITFITTPANASFLRRSLPSSVHLITLPSFTSPSLPPGCESTDTLPSIALHSTFMSAVASSLRSPFEALLTSLVVHPPPPPLCLISDFFLGWTLPICRRLSLPRIVFHGMSAFSMSIFKSLFSVENLHGRIPRQPFRVPGMPDSLLVDIGDVPEFFFRQPGAVEIENGVSDVDSWGVLVNSFAELEGEYADLFESFYRPAGGRAWLVGPLSMLGENKDDDVDVAGDCMRWLEEREVGSVIYVSFGTQTDVSEEQMDEVAHGLARSGCKFLWAVPRGRVGGWSPPPEVDGVGKIVEWAPQREVLGHRSTGGFLSHCGWNSVTEAVAAGVPMLAWPMMADQWLNAKFVVEELKIGVRISSARSDGEVVVSREIVEEGVREVMMNKVVRVRVRERAGEMRRKAEEAVADGGSSQRRLEEMIRELVTTARCRIYHDDIDIPALTTEEQEMRMDDVELHLDGIQIS